MMTFVPTVEDMQALADLQQTVANIQAYLGLAPVASMLPSFSHGVTGFPTAPSPAPGGRPSLSSPTQSPPSAPGPSPPAAPVGWSTVDTNDVWFATVFVSPSVARDAGCSAGFSSQSGSFSSQD
ncbi:hypothetical protein GUJ93_ZPchr0010g9828 [Zizania palustris]|uniref:Uncharacterized protein n=1 Tax=Zizania palustris TaxID=103762 RepID=A0A8J5WFQ8_ZIZPA|nr:hypothetical protein GUJ93_ZPchr0010g9828 [Zizania palustris]